MDIENELNQNLKHIIVYNKLHELIESEVFPVGYQLPTEPELAIKMGVSRVTLRKSLSLLREEGFIVNLRGKGNFVSAPDNSNKLSFDYKKKIQHPFYFCISCDIHEVEFSFKIEPQNPPMLKLLNQETAVIIVCERFYKNNSDIIGFSKSYLPIEAIIEYKINLNNPKELEDFVEKYIYSQSIKSNTLLTCSNQSKFITNKDIKSDCNYILVSEKLVSKSNLIIMYSDYYISSDYFQVNINLNDKFEF